MKLPLESARLAAWTTACLEGLVSPDDVAEHGAAPGQVHRVTGLPSAVAGEAAGHQDAASLPLAVASLRALGARRAWLAWPVAGDVSGLPGPAEVNRLVLEAGQAVLVETAGPHARSMALVPSRLGSSGIVWTALDVDGTTSAATSLGEAERELKAAIREATDALDALDVAATAPGAEDAVEAARLRPPPVELPRGFTNRAHAVLDTTQRLATLLGIARQGDGAAVSRAEAERRREVLRELERAVRHAFAASVNALAEDGARAR